MNVRDPVREVAEEIAESQFREANAPENHWLDESEDDYKSDQADYWEARLRSFLREHVSELLAERDRFADRLANNVHAQAERDSALTAALSEAAGLRGALERIQATEGQEGMTDYLFARVVLEEIIPEALQGRPPLSQTAAEVLEAAGLRGVMEEIRAAAQAYEDAQYPGDQEDALRQLLDTISGSSAPSPLSRAAAEVLEAAVEEADAVDAVRLVDDDTSPEAARASQRMDKAIARRVEAAERFRALLRGEGEEG